MKCRVCSTETIEWLDLGLQPLANELRQPGSPEPERFPLAVERCPECALSQLSTVVPPERLYTAAYPYRSGVSATWREHCRGIARMLPSGLMLDIGANDGTLVNMCREGVGLDPSPQGPGVFAGFFPATREPGNRMP